ncbi:hypothetical protein [Nibribacter koreensis]|uniref:hypothetical protein n=1 Tax=Nibribacter koreensis TaxID=1084519 RepID=UPI0031EF7A95
MPFIAFLPPSAHGREAPSSHLALYQLASFAWLLPWAFDDSCRGMTAVLPEEATCLGDSPERLDQVHVANFY